ncbi:MAG: hypothetical protein LBQ82_01220 [Treponema sp.]|jgi:hypothetical protein|nr:hypothetical protein [Treponema sp.]
MKLYKIVLIFILSLMLLQCHGKDNRISDSERFAQEYPLVGNDNIFVYKNAGETADILARGRGKERLRAGIGILKQIIGYSCNAC